MESVDREIELILRALRQHIYERGYTQLEVQEALGWGQTYISQLFTKQKELRYEQLLSILYVIDVEPREFFLGLHSGTSVPKTPEGGIFENHMEAVRILYTFVQKLARALVKNNVITNEELASAVSPPRPGSRRLGNSEAEKLCEVSARLLAAQAAHQRVTKEIKETSLPRVEEAGDARFQRRWVDTALELLRQGPEATEGVVQEAVCRAKEQAEAISTWLSIVADALCEKNPQLEHILARLNMVAVVRAKDDRKGNLQGSADPSQMPGNDDQPVRKT